MACLWFVMRHERYAIDIDYHISIDDIPQFGREGEEREGGSCWRAVFAFAHDVG